MKRLAGIILVVFLFSAAGFSFINTGIGTDHYSCDYGSTNFIHPPESVIHPFHCNPNFSSLDDEDETVKIQLSNMFLSERIKTLTITYLPHSNLYSLISDFIFFITDNSPPFLALC